MIAGKMIAAAIFLKYPWTSICGRHGANRRRAPLVRVSRILIVAASIERSAMKWFPARSEFGRFRFCLGFLAIVLAAFVSSTSGQSLEEGLIKDLRWRNIGNANQIGRISSIDALENDWMHVVVGTASGGVYKSTNGGVSWQAIFDNYGSASIGDVRIFQPDPNIIWVGTGEECGRNSAAWGDGVYKSTDGGRTFKNMGLRDTYNIGSVMTHPTDPNVVYVAALGSIFTSEGDRGLFKSTDGGETWAKLTEGLPNDYKNTGALYIVMDPSDPETLYVSFWERHRTAWQLKSGGPNGGIFKTTNGGRNFRKLTNGLPEGDSGKIGLAISRQNPKVVMAHYEHGYQAERGTPEYDDMTKLGSGIYRSEDGGESWTYMNRYWSRPFYYNHVAISPHDDLHTFHPNQNFQISHDGGRTLEGANGGGHCWHAIWLDPHNKSRYYTGHDGGLNLTHDDGENYTAFKNINATQYYRVNVDMRDPYFVYGGLQDSGSSGGPSMSRARGIYLADWFNVGGGDGMHVPVDPTDWRTMYVERDPRGQGGDVRRVDVMTRESVSIRPQKGENIINYDEYITPEIEQMQLDKGWGPSPGPGSGAFRWNWNQALELSPHDPKTIYLGANHLFKSTDRGGTWWLISPDLSKNDPIKTRKGSGGLTPDQVPGGGAEYYGTIVTVAESPVQPGVIWAGTDDGNVRLTKNGGRSWANVAENIQGLPSKEFYVSRVKASRFDVGTCYVAFDGHESGNFAPWVFKTSDFGETWTNITSNLPGKEPVYAIEQDTRNPNLLFVGTEFAIYYSINDGNTWTRFNRNLPTVAIHDIVVHPRDPDIIIGTHGRGIWIMDDISALQQMTPDLVSASAHLFTNEVGTHWLRIEPMDDGGPYAFIGENPPKGAIINYYLGPSAEGEAVIEIRGRAPEQVRRFTFAAVPGAGKVEWDLYFPEIQGGRRGRGGRGRGGEGAAAQGQRGEATSEPAAREGTPTGPAGATPIGAEAAGRRGQSAEAQAQRGEEPVLDEAGRAAQARGERGERGERGRGRGRRGGRRGRGGPTGTPAPPGVYRVTLTVGGQEYNGSIIVRQDPMLDAAN
jgi:photosystem II stability/assembly factor-like uncharacterized protein